MTKLQVRCIDKTDHCSAHERIRAIGGFYANGAAWKLSQHEAIQKIEEGSYRFFVSIDSKPLNVIIATSREGFKYLTTAADGEFPNQLLKLYECA